jgi:hypothetical protein
MRRAWFRRRTPEPSAAGAVIGAVVGLAAIGLAAWCAAAGAGVYAGIYGAVAAGAVVTTGREVWWLWRDPLSVARRELLSVSRLLDEGSWVLARDPDVLLSRARGWMLGFRYTAILRTTAEDSIAVATGAAAYRVVTVFTISPVDGKVQVGLAANPVVIGEGSRMATWFELGRRARRVARLQEQTGTGLADLDDIRTLIRQIKTAEPLPGDAGE